MSMKDIEKEARAHIIKTSSLDNWPEHVIIPKKYLQSWIMNANLADSERLNQSFKEIGLTHKEAVEAYNINFANTDLEILDKLAEIPTKGEKSND